MKTGTVVDVGGKSVRGLLFGEQFSPDAEAVLFGVSLIFFCGGARGGACVLFGDDCASARGGMGRLGQERLAGRKDVGVWGTSF